MKFRIREYFLGSYTTQLLNSTNTQTTCYVPLLETRTRDLRPLHLVMAGNWSPVFTHTEDAKVKGRYFLFASKTAHIRYIRNCCISALQRFNSPTS